MNGTLLNRLSRIALAISLTLGLVALGVLAQPQIARAVPIVGNPGFESTTISPWGAWQNATVVTGSAHTGEKSLQISGEGSAEQVVTGLTANTTYLLSGWAKTAAGVGVLIGAKGFGGSQVTTEITGTSYELATTSFTTATGNTSVTLFCYRPGGAGTSYCDDFVLTAKPAPPTTGSLAKPGFESASLSPWTAWQSAATVTNNAHTGNRALMITDEGSAEQVVTGLTGGTPYILTAWAKVGTTGNTVSIGAKDFGGAQVAASIGTTTYTSASVSFTTAPGSTSATIFCYRPNTAGSSYCDDFTLGAQPIGIPGAWSPVFADEFNGTSLDSTNWCANWVTAPTCTSISQPVQTGGANPETAAYDPAQVTVSGGTLKLSAVSTSTPVDVGGIDYYYRSGMIQSNGPSGSTPKRYFTYGAFEARIYTPAYAYGSGIANWPAWWADGQNWPTDGEMDIFEGIQGRAHYTFHGPGDNGEGIGGVSGDYSDYLGWHTYGAKWQSGSVSYYYDGTLVGTVSNDVTSAPMFLILNYAVDGNGGTGFWTVPATMEVDYVRVWQ